MSDPCVDMDDRCSDCLEIEADLKAEIEQLRGKVREAFRAGFWAWAGPTNEMEFQTWTKDEERLWNEWFEADQKGEQSNGLEEIS